MMSMTSGVLTMQPEKWSYKTRSGIGFGGRRVNKGASTMMKNYHVIPS